jgi:hypothetical protein
MTHERELWSCLRLKALILFSKTYTIYQENGIHQRTAFSMTMESKYIYEAVIFSSEETLFQA